MRVELTHAFAPFYLDTNVFIYAVDLRDPRKHEIARDIVERCYQQSLGVFSVQVMAEWRNVMIKKFGAQLSKDYRALFLEWMAGHDPAPMTGELICRAEALVTRFSLSPFDSTHVQTALDMNCRYFLSDDMQDGLVVDSRLEIVNPFK